MSTLKEDPTLALHLTRVGKALTAFIAGYDLQEECSAQIPLATFADPADTTLRPFTLEKVALFGFDFKITEDDQVELIEINGFNSGMKGFAKTNTTTHLDDLISTRADKALERYLACWGQGTLAYIGSLLTLSETATYRFIPSVQLINGLIAGSVYNSSFIDQLDPSWRGLDSIVASIIRAEKIFTDKLYTASLLDELGIVKSKSYRANVAGLQQLLENHPTCDFIVMKPSDGSLGKGVTITSKKDFVVPPEGSFEEEYIIEPFVKSKGIFCKETGALHDGCARYIVAAEQDKNGTVRLLDFSGYWRLCPKPIEAYGDLDAMRANLYQKALVKKLSKKEAALMQVAAHSIVVDMLPNI